MARRPFEARIAVADGPAPGALSTGLGPAIGESLVREAREGRARLFAVPALAAGAAIHLSLPADPPAVLLYPLAAFVLLVAVLALLVVRRGTTIALVAGACVLGLVAADVSVWRAAAPRILAPTGAVEITGHVLTVEPRHGRAPRVLLRVHGIEGFGPADVPTRLVLVGQRLRDLSVGQGISIRARLSPVPGPTHPGAYDPARVLWFSGVGGYAFPTGAPTPLRLPELDLVTRVTLAIEAWRTEVTQRIIARLGPIDGPVAAALVTGQRTAIPQDLTEAYAGSGLMHVLSISGLHLALVAGGVFVAMRAFLALVPPLALRLSSKKVAAIAAILVASAYEVISGGPVATTRAYVMCLVMFSAILFDRRAVTMRNLMLAAALILLVEPQAVLTPSFQMSFAATAALIAAYERGLFPRLHHHDQPLALRFLARVASVMIAVAGTSLLCEVAVLPAVLYYFQKTALLGVVGNVMAHAVIEFAVMPMVLVTLLLAPFGGLDWAIDLLGAAVGAMNAIAVFVASLPGATLAAPGFPTLSLVLSLAAVVWGTILRGPIGALGLLPYLAAFAAWSAQSPVDIRVSASGDLVAARASDGRLAFDAVVADPFTAGRWLEAAGDRRKGDHPSLLATRRCDPAGCTIALTGGRVLALPRTPEALAEDCRRADIVIAREAVPSTCPRPSLVLDRRAIGEARGIAIRAGPVLEVVTRRELCGARPWCPDPRMPPERRRFGRPVPTDQ